MPILTQTKPGRNPAPPGVHVGVLVDVVDMGVVEHPEYGKKHMVVLCWQVEELDPDSGERFIVARRFNNSLNEKAALAPMVEALLGRPVQPPERRPLGFDLETLLGKSCQLEVGQREGSKGGTFATVVKAMPLARGMLPLRTDGHYNRDGQKTATPQQASAGNGQEQFPFEDEDKDSA